MVGRFTALDPARDRRGDGDLYDYCMDDPVSRVDPTGLWSKENFDESKVSRDGLGQFASSPGGGAGSGSGGGGGGGGNAANPNAGANPGGNGGGGNPGANSVNATTPQPDSAILVADAGTTVTDAPGWLVADNSKPAPDKQSKAAAEAEQYTKPYADLKFPTNEYKRFNPDDPNDPNSRKNDPDFLKYGIHPDLPSEMVHYHAKVSDTTLGLGESGILTALGVGKDIRAGVMRLTALLKNPYLPPEKRIQLKNELAFLVLGENAYGVYARNMAVLASNTSTAAKNLARQTISSLGDAKYHFSQEFIAQQEAMADGWSRNLSAGDKARFATLARRMRDSGDKWTDAKKAAMQEFLEAVHKQAKMPGGIKITIGRTSNPDAMAETDYHGNIVFNENNKTVWAGDADQLITTLFHEVGHAWNYTLDPSNTKVSAGDRNALNRPAFQDGWVDKSLYESNPDEAHSRMIQKFARVIVSSGNFRNGKALSFSQYWGI